MSNKTGNQANRDIEIRSGNPVSLAPADYAAASILASMRRGGPNRNAVDEPAQPMFDMEAAQALVSLSQSGPNCTDVHERAPSMSDLEAANVLSTLSQSGQNGTAIQERPAPISLVLDVRTMRTRLDSTDEDIRGVNPFREAQSHGPLSAWERSISVAELAERLWSISLVHLELPQIELAAERITSTLHSIPLIIRFHRYSDVPEEVGRFVDMWDAAGYTPEMVLEMLCRNNLLIPRGYIVQRLGLQNAVNSVPTPQTLRRDDLNDCTSDDGFMEEDNLEEDERDDWESELELWYDEY
jgi:hypothetical protein